MQLEQACVEGRKPSRRKFLENWPFRQGRWAAKKRMPGPYVIRALAVAGGLLAQSNAEWWDVLLLEALFLSSAAPRGRLLMRRSRGPLRVAGAT